jgi:hypothetical protein
LREDQELFLAVLGRQAAQPIQPLGSEQGARCRPEVLEQGAKQIGQVRRPAQLRLVLLGSPQKFVRVAHDSRPAQLANPVDHLRRLTACEGEVAAVNHALHAATLDVSDHRLKRRQVAVDVGDDCERGRVHGARD